MSDRSHPEPPAREPGQLASSAAGRPAPLPPKPVQFAGTSPELERFLAIVALFSVGNSSNAFLLLRPLLGRLMDDLGRRPVLLASGFLHVLDRLLDGLLHVLGRFPDRVRGFLRGLFQFPGRPKGMRI